MTVTTPRHDAVPGATDRHRWDRFGTVLLLVMTSCVFTLVVLAGLAVHGWNVHGAALVCPPDMQAVRGGWAEPDVCTAAGHDLRFAEVGEYRLLSPWRSAAAVGAGVLAAGGLAFALIRHLLPAPRSMALAAVLAPAGLAIAGWLQLMAL